MFSDDQRKKNEQDRQMEHLVSKAMKMDSDVLDEIWRIFDYEYGLKVYHMFEYFMEMFTKQDSLDCAIWAGLLWYGERE
jgi:hypothetical protein